MLFALRSSLGERTFWKEAHLRDHKPTPSCCSQPGRTRRRSASSTTATPSGCAPGSSARPVRDRRARPDRRDVRAGLASRQALPGRGGRLGRALAVRHRAQPAAPVPQAQPDRDRGARAARAAARLRGVRGLRARRRAHRRARDGSGAARRGAGAARPSSGARSSCASSSSSPTTRSPAQLGCSQNAARLRVSRALRTLTMELAVAMKRDAARRPRPPRRLPRGRGGRRPLRRRQRRQAMANFVGAVDAGRAVRARRGRRRPRRRATAVPAAARSRSRSTSEPPTNKFMVRHIPDEPLPSDERKERCLDAQDCRAARHALASHRLRPGRR